MKIAIDGPAGSGKSTIARRLSLELQVPYLETGLAYRAMGYILRSKGKTPEESIEWEELKPLTKHLEIKPDVGRTIVLVDGKEVGHFLVDEQIGRLASIVGAVGKFREYINLYFRQVIGNSQVVVEGRDAGTNIIPDADIKLFITASAQERARRRYQQLIRAGKDVSYEQVLRDIEDRDRRDTHRKDYPFKPAEDAIIIDTTGKSVEEVLSEVLKIVKAR